MVLAVGQKDLRAFVDDVESMNGAMDVVEEATIHYQQARAREQNLVDQRPEHPNLLQIHFSADDDLVTGFQLFAEERGGPERPNSRFVAVLDPKTRQLIALVDYWIISPMRVGASAGVGCRYLVPEGSHTVGILGSSKQARAQLWAMKRAVPALDYARVYSPTAEHREKFPKDLSDWLGLHIEPVTSAQAAVEGMDVVGIANNARQPTFEMPWVKPGATVVTIGGPQQLPAEIVNGTRIVAPIPESVLAREPYATRLAQGTPSDDIVTALGDVIIRESDVRRTPEEVVVFEVGRLNLWSIAVANYAATWAAVNGLGTEFTLGHE